MLDKQKKSVFAFFGKKRTGKDTTAVALQTFLRLRSCRFAFSDHLKDLCQPMFEVMAPDDADAVSELYIEDYMKIHRPEVYRAIMCGVSDIMKSLNGYHYFSNELLKIIDRRPFPVCIITDGRYESELAALDRYRSDSERVVTIRLSNEPFVEEVTSSDSHSSETSLDSIEDSRFDYVIDLKAKTAVHYPKDPRTEAYTVFEEFLRSLGIATSQYIEFTVQYDATGLTRHLEDLDSQKNIPTPEGE